MTTIDDLAGEDELLGRVQAAKAAEPAMARIETLTEELRQARERISNLDEALKTNRQIGMAIGIVMVRRGLTSTAAFEALRTASQRSHRKLRELADEVVLTGELPST